MRDLLSMAFKSVRSGCDLKYELAAAASAHENQTVPGV
jgi:hypothetical protein